MNHTDKKKKYILVIGNAVLIVIMVISTMLYSRHVYYKQEKDQKKDFIRTIESMKRVSQNYFESERGYVKNWAAYISGQNMTIEEALDFLRSINTNKERFAHIVDMDSYEAYSSYYPKDEEEIDTYLAYKNPEEESELSFSKIMQNMFEGNDKEFAVLGKYRLQETQTMAVGLGTKVTLSTDAGTKDYLLLRIIPTEVLKKSWVFPMEYNSAEVGIITHSGDYVIQSSSMKSQNFIEYIRGYNFEDDYNESEVFRKQLMDTDNGVLEYKNFRGEDCLWYYSSFGSDSALDILGVINVKDLRTPVDAWHIILLVCGMLIILVIIDGSYLISMNHRLRETARISEEASRAKTQFLSAMSHDIRTPLNAVIGMMVLAKKRSDDKKYVEECMDKGMHSGKQLLTLINDVLDISKIESGEVTLNLDTVSLEELIQDITEMLTQYIEHKDIQLDCDFSNLPHKYVCADQMRLNQIYVNLLTNAVKYTKAGGKILLRLFEQTIPEDATNTRLVFYVEDNGIGMTEEFQKRMYSMFAREINTQVNSTQGTGLGLSIVKQMVDLMNGTITCQSVPGQGTSFTVCIDLPIVDMHKENVANDTDSQDVKGMHLLVAEDNELNWEIVCELLMERGITCDRAVNGQECIYRLEEEPVGTYDAILMDIQMPVMNGYEATKAIRSLSDDKLKKIAIIAMTADAFAEDVQACMDCGMNGHIAKPINMDKLISYLVKIRNGEK